MYDTRTEPAPTATTAAEQIRILNHITQDTSPTWEFPKHSYYVIGSLAHMARMLGQAIEQSIRPAEGTHARGRLTIDHDGDPEAAMVRLKNAAGAAITAAATLATALDEMHAATSSMGARLDDDQDPAEPTACAKCRHPFNPDDLSYAGAGRHASTPFCRSCVDRCMSTEIADHFCAVDRWNAGER
ncbi:hypothetical protein [Streptomyces sp. NPDC101115]|uniref:hypothetical protein n=1 Tax=Streptomyces sp. NPDC101115 TaxID=3366106 RepID=UPI00382E1C86